MLWNEKIPMISEEGVEVKIISGGLSGIQTEAPPNCPPNSWASEKENNVNILTIKLEPNTSWTLPPSQQASLINDSASATSRTNNKQINKCLYFFTSSEGLLIDDQPIPLRSKIDIDPFKSLKLSNVGNAFIELLLLEGKPINEPVVQHGPFVMNTRDEIMQAFQDYQRTEFGKWPWKSDDPVHDRSKKRFAKYPDGRIEEPALLGQDNAAEENTCA